MAEVSPRRRIRPVVVDPASPPPRVRPAAAPSPPPTPSGEEPLYERWDGPASPAPVRDTTSGQLVTPVIPLIERADTLMALGAREEAEELLLQTMHQFLLARTPGDIIARRMNISMRTYRTLRDKLGKRIREDAKTKDPFDFIGASVAEMEEVAAQAWRDVAAAPAKEWSRRDRALNTIMRANAEKQRLLQLTGLYDNQPMRRPLEATDEEDGGASVLKRMAENFLTGGYQANAEFRNSPTPADTVIDQ